MKIIDIDTINLKEENGIVTIKYPPKYRNGAWGNGFGLVQEYFRNISSKISVIVIDLSEITWIDPLPILSLLLSIAEIRKNENFFELKIRMIIPKENANLGKSKKVLAFLSLEGFIDQFQKLNVDIIEYSLENIENLSYQENGRFEEIKDYKKIYSSLAGELKYTNCSIIGATIEDLVVINYKYGSIDKWIKELVNQIKYVLKNKIESYKSEEVLYQLQSLLSETISNVYEHAYNDKEYKYVGFYVRFRKGILNTGIGKQERDSLYKASNEENDECPKLNKYFIDNIFSFLEIFVIDAGCGLSYNYFPEKSIKYPFRKAWEMAIIDGTRGIISTKKSTQFGGLYSICRKLGHNYVCSRDCNEWIGHSLPLRARVIPSEITSAKKDLTGFSIIFRLTWDVATDNVESWEKLILDYDKTDGDIKENIYYNILCDEEDIGKKYFNKTYSELIKNNYFNIIDERFNTLKDIKGTINKITPLKTQYCIYLPDRGLTKNEIFNFIDSYYSHVQCDSRTLIILDILVHQAHYFQLALENATFKSDFINNYDRIILVTQRLSVLILQKKGKFFVCDKEAGIKYIKNIENEFLPEKSLKNLVAWQKTHDSLLFWMNVEQKSETCDFFYINGPIKWYSNEKEITMIGYLNFAQILADTSSRAILENSLARTFCFSESGGCRYRNIDILTEQLCSKMNSLFYNELPSKEKSFRSILVGSILASGSSLENAKGQTEYNESIIPIHFFKHQGINRNNCDQTETYDPHLLLWPTEWLENHFIKTNIDYRRVGRSHVIAPFGWKYYPIPRFKIWSNSRSIYLNDSSNIEEDENVEFRSAYECSPAESYENWQVTGKQILEIGHYSYENKHDLLKIDYLLAVSDSFNEGGHLAQFLLSEFLVALGTDTRSIENDIQHLYKNDQKERTSQSDNYLKIVKDQFISDVNNAIYKLNIIEECALIVYPSHFNTEHIIEIIKTFINPELHERICALIPISKERESSAYLISPFILENIRKKITEFKNKGKEPKVLLFDEVTIDGKTRKEIKHILFYLGASEVKTLCLLDRRRLPFSTSDPSRHKAYWRLDIPRLGSRDSCVLCKSIDKISSFKTHLIYSIDKGRINNWIYYWGSTFPYSKSFQHGLSSKPLQSVMSKKFSLYFDKESGGFLPYDNILLTNSIGVSLYAGEVFSMTSRDDYSLELCKKNDFSEIEIIEILSFNLLNFSKEFSYSTTSSMASKLFQTINSIEETNHETALGVLTLLSLPHRIIETLISSLKENNSIISNKDIEIFLCIFAQEDDSPMHDIQILRRHFKSSYISCLNDVYSNFHNEIYNKFGRIHDTSLVTISEITSISPFKEEIFLNAISSCDKLSELINNFPIWNCRSHLSNEITKQIIEKIIHLKKGLESFTSEEYQKEECINAIQFEVENVQRELIYFHSHFFVNIGIQDTDKNNFPLKNEIQSITNTYKFDEEICESLVGMYKFNKSDAIEFEQWISWDKQVKNKVKYLINNARHGIGYIAKSDFDTDFCYYTKDDSRIKCDKNSCTIVDDGITKLLYRMLISIEYKDTFLEFHLYNYSPIDHIQITNRTNKKNKPEKEHIKELKGKIYYKSEKVDNGLHLLDTILELPYR